MGRGGFGFVPGASMAAMPSVAAVSVPAGPPYSFPPPAGASGRFAFGGASVRAPHFHPAFVAVRARRRLSTRYRRRVGLPSIQHHSRFIGPRVERLLLLTSARACPLPSHSPSATPTWGDFLPIAATGAATLSPLIRAISHSHLAVAERLLADPRVDPSAGDNAAIREASAKGHLSVVERLLADPRVDPSAHDNAAIREASANGHISIVERLLADRRVDPSSRDNNAIREASKNGHLAVVERLLADPRVNPSALGNSPLLWATYGGHLAVVERLLADSRIDILVSSSLAVCLASRNGHLAVVERLLADARVDPSAAVGEKSSVRAGCFSGPMRASCSSHGEIFARDSADELIAECE
jgi:ankyrin repeat protein